MRNFRCQCGQILFFENALCEQCGRTLGYIPELTVLAALEPMGDGLWQPYLPVTEGSGLFRQCSNYSQHNVCNWLVAADDPQTLCQACRLNAVIPDLSRPENRVYWGRMEVAKRRLVYTLLGLGLPLVSKHDDSRQGLVFQFLADPEPGFGQGERVMTGHMEGVITINLAEADDVAREQMRENMSEPYRTLLGHFRHESGHYYWERLLPGSNWLVPFREVFGDERADYGQAMQNYHAQGAPPDWGQRFISAYASSHPWEDWAETWAHYLHMADTLETAADIGLISHGQVGQEADDRWVTRYFDDFEDMVEHWTPLTLAINSLNRSMGLQDAYPFVLSRPAVDKLRFVHRVMHQWQRGS